MWKIRNKRNLKSSKCRSVRSNFSPLFRTQFLRSVRRVVYHLWSLSGKNELWEECSWIRCCCFISREFRGYVRWFFEFLWCGAKLSCGLRGRDSERAYWDFDEWLQQLFALIYRDKTCRQSFGNFFCLLQS